MKKINISLIVDIKNSQSYVEYQIMNGGNDKVLKSLHNPDTSEDAFNMVKNLIEKSDKYSFHISTKSNIIYKIIAESFMNNRKIEDQLNIFYQQIAPKVAQTRVETGFVVGTYANQPYKPLNTIDFDNQMAA